MLKKAAQTSRRLANQLTRDNWQKITAYIQQFGYRRFLAKAAEKISFFASNQENAFDDAAVYRRWIAANEPTEAEITAQSKAKFKLAPKISIIVPTYNTPLEFLRPMVESVRTQTYPNWELCIADGSQESSPAKGYLQELISQEPRVRVKFLDKNNGIAGNTNAAIELATGEYVALLDHDDTLAPFALFEVVTALNAEPTADVIYSDEDKLSTDGRRRLKPHFKPDWSPDTIRSYNYITHLLVLKRTLLEKVGLIRSGFEGAQDFDLVLRATESAKKIVHLPKILYHWREHANSTAANVKSKDYASYATKKAVADHLHRINLPGRVVDGPFFGACRVLYDLPRPLPLVSIIIPTKDQVKTLQQCLNSIRNRSTYSNYEIILVDTGSQETATKEYYQELESWPNVRILTWAKPFNFSAVNNFAARSAQGSLLLLLNNDTEVISSDWLEAMVEFAARSDVGAVGAKLLYPDATVQHGGVVLGIGGVAGHSHKYFPGRSYGYFGRLVVPQNFSAVTAACVMIPKAVFEAVGGLDEGYALAFNDVDLCLKIRALGKLIVWTPHAELFHHESKTRGLEDTPEKQARFKSEIDRFHSKWSDWLAQGDPYYSPNLSLTKEDFSIKVD